jgi:hypothetical protein
METARSMSNGRGWTNTQDLHTSANRSDKKAPR